MEEIILKVDGMMCAGCEKRVENVVSKIENIQSVKADHENGKVTIQVNGIADIKKIKSAIEDLDYKVIE